MTALVLSACGDAPPLPAHAARLAIEGFYGEPYSFAARTALFDALPQHGFTGYLYAPKQDPQHRERWREPYPAAHLAHFADLVARGRPQGTRFIYALSPGADYRPGGADDAALTAKLDALFDAGVRDFCVLFDDVLYDAAAADPAVQVELVTKVHAHLIGRDPAATLAFISNYYYGTAAQLASGETPPMFFSYDLPSTDYYAAYRRIPREVAILWTGRAVFSARLTVEDVAAMRAFVGRPLWIWDNVPVNDLLFADELFLGPWLGREPALDHNVDAVGLNLGLQPEASRIALHTAGRALALGDAYDPWAAWEEALAVVSGGAGLDPLRLLAEHFASHPFLGDNPESPRLGADIGAFLAAPGPATAAPLRAHLQSLAEHHAALRRDLANRALADELAAPSRKLALLGEAGVVGLDLWAAKTAGQPIDRARLDSLLAAAAAIPWRVAENRPFLAAGALLLTDATPKPAQVFQDLFAALDRLLAP